MSPLPGSRMLVPGERRQNDCSVTSIETVRLRSVVSQRSGLTGREGYVLCLLWWCVRAALQCDLLVMVLPGSLHVAWGPLRVHEVELESACLSGQGCGLCIALIRPNHIMFHDPTK